MLVFLACSILMAWLACASVLTGIGALVLRKMEIEHGISNAFWVGLCVSVFCLECYHFFRPIDILIVILLSSLGLCGIFLNVRTIVRNIVLDSWPAVCYLLSVLLIAVRCAGPVVHYDTGFYGATAVRWFDTFPLVPGLTNLLRQLGLNSNVFLSVAGLDQGPFRGLAVHLFAGLLLCVLAATIVRSFFNIYHRKEEPLVDYFVLLLVVPGIVWVLNGEIVGTNTDIPTTIVSIAGMIALLQVLQVKNDPNGQIKRMESNLVVASLLFTLAVTFKISSLVFASLGWVGVFAQYFSPQIRGDRRRLLVFTAIGFSAALVIPWLIRGVILSGYLLYPSSVLPFPVDWRVPAAVADLMNHTNQSWARIPNATFEETRHFHWLLPWFGAARKNRVDFLIPLILSLAGISVWLRSIRPIQNFRLWVLGPSLGGLVFWFTMAPSFRFGEAAIWTTAASLGSVALKQTLPLASNVLRRGTLFVLLALGAWCSYPRTLWKLSFEPLRGLSSLPRMPAARAIPYRLASGLTVLVPVETNQCWNAALPCSPYFADSLFLRRDTDLRWGFRVGALDLTNNDKFTMVHKKNMKAQPTDTVCLNCHLPEK